MDYEVVTPIGDYGGAGNCAIKGQSIPFVSIRSKCGIFNGEPIFYMPLALHLK
jgi:hypothetical protein